ncbi:MAG: hypothetical protein R3F60_32175 [bacterium]
MPLRRWQGPVNVALTLQAHSTFRVLPGNDPSPVCIPGVYQCTVISIRDRVTGARIVAHFGGYRGSRRPNADDLRRVFRAFLTHTGALHSVDVRIAGNSTSFELSLDEAARALGQLHPHIHIQQDTYAGSRFYVDDRGRIFGLEDPRDTRRTAGFSLGTRGGGSGSRGITLGSRPVIDEKK